MSKKWGAGIWAVVEAGEGVGAGKTTGVGVGKRAGVGTGIGAEIGAKRAGRDRHIIGKNHERCQEQFDYRDQ